MAMDHDHIPSDCVVEHLSRLRPEHGMNTPAPRGPSPPAETRDFLFAIEILSGDCCVQAAGECKVGREANRFQLTL
jgi:hypothetical protein